MATAAAHLPLTRAESSAVERMADAAARRQLTVFGPSSYRVPEADPGSPVWCVSSQRRNGAWHLVWVQTVDGVPRLMCSCPARQSPRVFTCSHAQAVRLQLAAQCAARGSRPSSYVESPAPASPPAPSGLGLGSAVAPWSGWGTPPAEAEALAAFARAHHAAIQARIDELERHEITFTVEGPDDEIPADAVESLRAWSEALDAAGPLPLPADLGEPEPDEPDPDDDPDPLPPAAAAAVEPGPVEPEPDPAPARLVHCPRCGGEANPDVVAAHGACAACIQRRPTLSQAHKRTPAEKAEARRRIIAAEELRQRRYRRDGRDDDPRREEQRRERAEKAEARRRERRESDDAEREASILYRDNRGISPWR